ncbi:hypothetical protein PENTCL1PPCAC_26230, partial [Pristionchus entomophagus]
WCSLCHTILLERTFQSRFHHRKLILEHKPYQNGISDIYHHIMVLSRHDLSCGFCGCNRDVSLFLWRTKKIEQSGNSL